MMVNVQNEVLAKFCCFDNQEQGNLTLTDCSLAYILNGEGMYISCIGSNEQVYCVQFSNYLSWSCHHVK